jgi:hypothetical protein
MTDDEDHHKEDFLFALLFKSICRELVTVVQSLVSERPDLLPSYDLLLGMTPSHILLCGLGTRANTSSQQMIRLLLEKVPLVLR